MRHQRPKTEITAEISMLENAIIFNNARQADFEKDLANCKRQLYDIGRELTDRKRQLETRSNFDALIAEGFSQQTIDLAFDVLARMKQVKKLREGSRQARRCFSAVNFFCSNGKCLNERWERDRGWSAESFERSLLYDCRRGLDNDTGDKALVLRDRVINRENDFDNARRVQANADAMDGETETYTDKRGAPVNHADKPHEGIAGVPGLRKNLEA